MPKYLWQCDSCSQELEVYRPLDDYTIPPTGEEVVTIEEVKCQHVWRRLISKVSFQSTERNVGKNERARNTTFQRLKESYKVESEMANLPHDKRGAHQKEIKKLRS